jgi:hypothetical protein
MGPLALVHIATMAPRGKKAAPEEDGEGDLLEQYLALLDELKQSAYELALHQQHLQLTAKLGDADGLEGAREMMSTYFPLSEGEPRAGRDERERGGADKVFWCCRDVARVDRYEEGKACRSAGG